MNTLSTANSIVKMAVNKRSEDMSYIFNAQLTLVLTAFITGLVVAMNVLGLSSGAAFGLTLNISGGIGGSLNNFILPGLMYRRAMPASAHLHTAAAIEIVFGVAIMCTVCIATLVSIVK